MDTKSPDPTGPDLTMTCRGPAPDTRKKNLRLPLSISSQSSDDPDVSGPEVTDVGQFSSRLEKQCHRPSVSEGAPPNGRAEHDSTLGPEARVVSADMPKRAGRRLDHLPGS